MMREEGREVLDLDGARCLEVEHDARERHLAESVMVTVRLAIGSGRQQAVSHPAMARARQQTPRRETRPS